MTEFYIPTKEQIQSFQVGDLAPNCFSEWRPITKISARQQDINGKWFICYNTEFGRHSTITDSLKEDELHRSVETSKYHTSAVLDAIEQRLLKERK